jgi:hypothetical protein
MFKGANNVKVENSFMLNVGRDATIVRIDGSECRQLGNRKDAELI